MRLPTHCWTAAGIATLASALLAVAFLETYEYEEQLFSPVAGGPLVVVDRAGEVLRTVPSKDGRPGREHWVPLSDVSSHAVLTLLASEDQGFYEHHGVDPVGLLRALWLTTTRPGRYGGSTLSMQLARMVYSPGESRSVANKLVEVRAALGFEPVLGKRGVLEQYLNRAYYGNGAYGIEAAAQRYFGKPARALSVGESTFLVVLPRGPSYYDPTKHMDRALARREHLFGLLVAQDRLSSEEAERALAQPLDVRLRRSPFEAPHFVDWVLESLPRELLRSGGTVRTTLDLDLQRTLERRTGEHVRELSRHEVRQAGVVVLDSEEAAVLAMVGSPDFRAPHGQINMTTWRRHPGSALKPFVYGTAIERGESPASIAHDVRDISDTYRVPNAREHGPASFREALAGSYNFAAVDVLGRAGVERVMGSLRTAGVASLDMRPREYGPRLALGASKVRLLDLTAAYRVFVHGGLVRPPSGIREVLRHDGTYWRPGPRSDRRVFSEEASWLVMDMLSDSDARRPVFGHDLPVDFPFPVVAKTGTAEGFSDAVTVIATRELLVGAWSGRVDGRAMRGKPAMTLAAPLARAALLGASDGAPLTLPPRPGTLERGVVCPVSGLLPGPHCVHRRRESFVPGTVPTRTCDWHGADGHVHYPDVDRGWLRRTTLDGSG